MIALGFKFLPFQKPRECWAEPGHIYLEDNGRIIDCPSTIKESLPVQVNQFQSTSAMWVLYNPDRTVMYVGNKFGTYTGVRLSDGVLLSCGSWNKPFREWDVCGYIDDNAILIDVHDKRTLVMPIGGDTFVLHNPIYGWDTLQGEMYRIQASPHVPIVFCERGLISFERDGTWVSTPEARGPSAPLQL